MEKLLFSLKNQFPMVASLLPKRKVQIPELLESSLCKFVLR